MKRMLSNALPRPSILMSIPYSISTDVKTSEVNCAPWSVLKIAGQPYCSIVSRKSRAYCPASIVLKTCHDNTFREYQSIIAIRYTFPLGSLIYVMSVDLSDDVLPCTSSDSEFWRSQNIASALFPAIRGGALSRRFSKDMDISYAVYSFLTDFYLEIMP